jgi:Zn-dependent peptidase ImmA (M78 family)
VLLGITLAEQKEWRDRSGYQPLREWIDAVEALGVLVMQDGSLTVDEMRGFASTHPSVPAIVVNTNDDPRSRAFTTIHELGHLVRVRAGRPSGPSTEQWCNDFASSVLMPRGWFARDFRRLANRPLLDSIDALALEYGTTAYATAVRAGRIHLAPQRDVDDVIDEIRERGRDGGEQAGGGGNYYLTTVTRLGPAYIRLVLAAMEGQAVTYPAAAELLGVKVNNFGKLRERIALRGR